MRNLKRALSLALASVMLLGMMVVGSSAAFSDADEIVNKEAVEVTAGLGLFAGSDGKFNPQNTVTRAEMATVIVKMLYGSEINADQFKGNGKFSDVSGWAEGYINLCANLGIVGGYGDGTFQPDKKLNTAEALTMIINALGADAGEGTWPMTVMAKAEEMELFKNVEGAKPSTYAELSRDQLAVAVWAGLNWSKDGVKGYKIDDVKIEFKTLADAIAYAEAKDGIDVDDIKEIKEGTLAKDVFNADYVTGYITANKATGNKYTVIGGKNYNIETGLDQLNHYVSIYFTEEYSNENKPGKAVAVVEKAEYVTVEKAIDKKADYLEAFGSKVESTIEIDGYNEKAYTATATGTYVICTDTDEMNKDREGKIIAIFNGPAAAVGEVTAVSETAGKEYIKIGSKRYNNNADEDVIVAYDGIAEDDIVVYKTYTDSELNTMTYVYKPEVISGKITKTKDATTDYANRIWVDGTEYEMSSTDASALLTVYGGINLATDAENTYDVYLYNGKVLGVKVTEGNADIGEVVYVTAMYNDDVKGNYGTTGTKTYYYAQGVDAKGEEIQILIGIDGCSKDCTDECDECEHVVRELPTNAFYTFKKSTDGDQAKKGIMAADPVVDVAAFDADDDDYFAAAVDSVNGDAPAKFAKNSKYVNVVTDVADCEECEACLDEDDETACTEPVIETARVYLNTNTQYFVVDDTKGIADLKVTTYTGGIAKDITDADVDVIATEDDNGNRYAQLVVIYAESGLAAEDYIYVSTIAAADASSVKGGIEVVAYFSETDEFKTIVVEDEAEGFYTDWTIDEETGVYTLADFEGDAGVFEDQLLTGIVGDAIITADDIDLFSTAGVKIYDLRDPEVIKYSEVAEIETLKDLESILKDEKHVYFDAIVDTEVEGKEVVTHIFVYSVQLFVEMCDGSAYITEDSDDGWYEDDGTTFTKEELCATLATEDEAGDHECDDCGLKFTVIAEEEEEEEEE